MLLKICNFQREKFDLCLKLFIGSGSETKYKVRYGYVMSSKVEFGSISEKMVSDPPDRIIYQSLVLAVLVLLVCVFRA